LSTHLLHASVLEPDGFRPTGIEYAQVHHAWCQVLDPCGHRKRAGEACGADRTPRVIQLDKRLVGRGAGKGGEHQTPTSGDSLRLTSSHYHARSAVVPNGACSLPSVVRRVRTGLSTLVTHRDTNVVFGRHEEGDPVAWWARKSDTLAPRVACGGYSDCRSHRPQNFRLL
jgi:hypothetical protein